MTLRTKISIMQLLKMDLSRVSKKSPHEDSRMTLNAIDCKTMDSYNNYYNTLPDKKKLLAQLIRKKNSSRTKYSNEYHELSKRISELELEIYEIENKTHQINYLMKAASHFLEYTQQSNQSQQRKISKFTPPSSPIGHNDGVEIDSILDSIDEEKESLTPAKFFITRDGTNRGKICQEYIKECIGEGYSLSTKSNEFEINQELTCKNCGVEKLTNPRESYASCPYCGEISKYQDTQNNKGEYSEEVEVLSPFAYKRINHFKEWISTLIAREGSGPPQEVIDELLRELKKDKVETREEVTEERIKGYLKKLKHAKLYEHIPAIIFKICGVPPPQISPRLEAKLIEMFQQIQNPFEKHAPKGRKNFLSYSYTIHKMLELLRQSQLVDKLPLLKSREKLYQQDVIWKGICFELKWRYFASL
jgi:polyhydroxyalkanoate synthesis regulator phasin